MITLTLESQEFYDDETNTFRQTESKTVDFEYSLLGVSRWEAKWKIPFLNSNLDITDPRFLDFLTMMAINRPIEVDELTDDAIHKLVEYISDPQTATTFRDQNDNTYAHSTKAYTSEEIYAIMFLNGVPIELESKNLSRLLVILKIISIYNNPDKKKMSQQDIIEQNRRLNEERKKKYQTKG